MYNNDSNFLYRARQTVYKWWCVVYKPVYRLFHDGNWPEEKNPYYQKPADNLPQSQTQSQPQASTQSIDHGRLAEEKAAEIMKGKQGNIDNIVNNTDKLVTPAPAPEPELDLSSVDKNTLDMANEIMARLAREAAEDEAKKQAEIEAARAKANEEARLASIIQSTKVDISSYIKEGMANRDNE